MMINRKSYMMKKTYLYRCGILFLLLVGMCSCSENSYTDGQPEENPDLRKQTIKIYIGGNSDPADISTRDVPPGIGGGGKTGTCNVNEVALMVFRRKVGTEGDFLFDKDNSAAFNSDGFIQDGGKTLTDVKPVQGSTSNMKETYGTITKSKDYEYRIFALGYNTARVDIHPNNLKINEREDFKIVDAQGKGINENTTLSEVKLQLVKRKYSELSDFLAHRDYKGSHSVLDAYKINNHITGYWVRTPEIFYGTCYTVNKQDETISFQDDNEVTGTLYRGVARVDVTIANLKNILNTPNIRHVCEFSLLVDSLRTEVYLNSYDNFKTPEALLLQPCNDDGSNDYGSDANSSNYMTFTAVAGENKCMDDSSSITLSFFVLPTITQMRTRYATTDNVHSSIWVKYSYESYIAVPSESNGNQATGVIDPGAAGKKFYFRRNQKYVINGDGQNIKDNEEGKS